MKTNAFFRSWIFKLIVTATIALGLIFLTPDCLSTQWKVIIAGSLFLITNLSGWISKSKWITHFFRIATGALFIFSGTIKSNDPTGFAIKLKEYFEIFEEDFSNLKTGKKEVMEIVKNHPRIKSFAQKTSTLNNPVTEEQLIERAANFFDSRYKNPSDKENILISSCKFFHDHAVGLAIIICVSEVALGLMLLLGILPVITLWLLLAQIVFFTFLTFYSACYNKVTHCGCFGDFLKLTPWTSFGKDIALLIAIAFLFSGKSNIQPVFKTGIFNWIAGGIALLFSIWFPIRCYQHLPVWDFLPFYDGASVCMGRQNGPNYKPAVFQVTYTYKNSVTGEERKFEAVPNMNLPTDTNWVYVSRNPDVLLSEEQDAAKITTYTMQDLNGNEIADSLLQSNDYYFLLIMNSLNESEKNPELIKKLNEFCLSSEKEEIKFLALTHDFEQDIKKYKFENQAMFDFAISDDVQLKMMIRSNPGLMLFKGCTMIKKWHYNDLPSFTDVKKSYFK
jgi:hypothetical protein